jgi:hypothetical protein
MDPPDPDLDPELCLPVIIRLDFCLIPVGLTECTYLGRRKHFMNRIMKGYLTFFLEMYRQSKALPIISWLKKVVNIENQGASGMWQMCSFGLDRDNHALFVT